jgi:iron complex outermembrane recepter protein
MSNYKTNIIDQKSLGIFPKLNIHKFTGTFLGILTMTFVGSHNVYAEHKGSKKAKLKEIIVSAPKVALQDRGNGNPGTLTVPNNAEALEIIRRTPGGVHIVGAERYEDDYPLSFEDTLEYVPGVYAKKRFGEEVRLGIRGAGLSRGFHLRGLRLLQDGIPFNLADGGGDFQEADFLALQRIEVYKGGNAMQYGGVTLGGSVNMISKTGHSHPGDLFRTEIGSDSTYRGHIQSGRSYEKFDFFVSATAAKSDGFRNHAEQENAKFNGNLGIWLSDNVETRFFLTGNEINLELPGTVDLSTALNSPQTANSFAISDDQQRDINSVRFSNKTTFKFSDDHLFDVGAYVNYKELFHPIIRFVGVIDQESVDYGVYAQGAGSYKLGGFRSEYRLGVTTQFGDTDAKVFANNSGQRGTQTADSDQTADNVVVYGQNNLYVTPKLALVTGAQFVYAKRKDKNFASPSETDSDTYDSFNPKLGAIYEASKTIQFFGNVSKSYEPPTFIELTQGGITGFTPVRAQKAWTAEVGTRGEYKMASWDITFYRAWVEDEMLQFTVGAGFPASTFNADDTIHQGLEFGLDLQLAQSLLTSGDSLRWRNVYNYNHFYFEGDSQFGDNDIAGQPKNAYQGELRYDYGNLGYLAVNVDAADRADVDFANNLEAPGFAIMGLSAGYNINKNINVFFSGRNLLNKRYISTFSTITDSSTASTSVFYAGDDRRFFSGVTVNF